MPLIKSNSKQAIGQNIKTEQTAGRPHKQAVAIALNTADRAGGMKKPPVKKKAVGTKAAKALGKKSPFAKKKPGLTRNPTPAEMKNPLPMNPADDGADMPDDNAAEF